MRYRHLFFDLDHTLWDFRTNSRATLEELHAELELAFHGLPDKSEFIAAYEEINAALWAQYAVNGMDKEVLRVLRFRNTLLQFGVKNDKLVRTMSHLYIERCPQRTALMPGALEVLEHVKGKCTLHIITNGFQETQHIKLKSSGLVSYFDCIVTSEKAGARKPEPRIFQYALNKARAAASESAMIGDDVKADIHGARSAGMDQLLFDPDDKHVGVEATNRLRRLNELIPLLA